jgi:hypothetical protein
MKVLKVVLAMTLAAALLLGVALPGLAAPDETEDQPEQGPWPQMLRGEVSSINEAEELFTIQAGERTIDIQVNEGTKYFEVSAPRRLLALRQGTLQAQPEGVDGTSTRVKPRAIEQAASLRNGKLAGRRALRPVPSQDLAPDVALAENGEDETSHLPWYLKWLRRFGEEAAFDDIAVGDRVIVGVVRNNGTPLAKLVLIIGPADDGEPGTRPRMLRGEVTSINPTEEIFTIQAGERSIDIQVNEGTKYFVVKAPRRLLALLRHRTTAAQPEDVDALTPVEPRATEQAASLRNGKLAGRRALRPVENPDLAPYVLAENGEDETSHLPGYLKWLSRFGEEAAFDDIAVGDKVVVGVVRNNGTPLAKLVLIIKPSAYNRVVGEVTEITDDTITIAPEEGDAVELNYDSDTVFVLRGTPYLEEGEKAVAIYVETDDGLLAKKVMQGERPTESTE